MEKKIFTSEATTREQYLKRKTMLTMWHTTFSSTGLSVKSVINIWRTR